MKPFLELRNPAPTKTTARVTPSYVEVEVPLPAGVIIAYAVKLDDKVGAAMTCWDDRFDKMIELGSDPKSGSIYLAEFRHSWPTFVKACENAAKERYGDGAISQFIDPDDLNRKWFLAVLFSFQSDKEFNEKADASVAKVAELTVQMGLELEVPINWKQMVRAAAKAAIMGARDAQKSMAPWKAAFSWLQFASDDA